jgi:protein gp37
VANNSKIEWTEATWNPLAGCTKISPGCKFCYAERLAIRLQAMGNHAYARGFQLTLHEDSLDLPLRWRKPRTVFVNSMSDLFQENVPPEFIAKVFDVMNKASWHTFQVLTKRAERLYELNSRLRWTPNIWMGVSVENEDHAGRIDYLRRTSATLRFLSLEPLIGPVANLNLERIDWVIVGGESGPGARPMRLDWVQAIRERCHAMRVPFFFKQWGGANKAKTGRVLEGRTWDEMPILRPDTGDFFRTRRHTSRLGQSSDR